MRRLEVCLEIGGEFERVGYIVGESSSDACFLYDKSYVKKENSRAISHALPLKERHFSSETTRNFFEGLLPEGFTRRSVAKRLKIDEEDYLELLSKLGMDCIGAVRISEEGTSELDSGYSEISMQEISALAEDGAVKAADMIAKTHLSLTGASGKVGLYFDDINKKWYLPTGLSPSTHIVKQSHVRLKNIVVNELLSLMTARSLGINVVDSFVVNTGNYKDDEVLYATKRYDRVFGDKLTGEEFYKVFRLHQEDFSQALGIAAKDKYETEKRGYVEEMFNLIRSCSANPISDQTSLWDGLMFNYLIGNTDGHIKNYSLLYSNNMEAVGLAPLYDVISTAVYEESTGDMSVYIGEKKDIYSIQIEDIKLAAKEAGIGVDFALKEYNRLYRGFEGALRKCSDELVSRGMLEAKQICEKCLDNFNRYAVEI